MRAVFQALTGQADGTCGARQGRRCRACSVLGAGFLFVTSPIRQIINPGWPFCLKTCSLPSSLSPLPSATNQTATDQTQETSTAPTISLNIHRRAESSFVIGLALHRSSFPRIPEARTNPS